MRGCLAIVVLSLLAVVIGNRLVMARSSPVVIGHVHVVLVPGGVGVTDIHIAAFVHLSLGLVLGTAHTLCAALGGSCEYAHRLTPQRSSQTLRVLA